MDVLRRYWLLLLAFLAIIGLAVWVQFTKDTNSTAKWIFNFVDNWSAALGAAAAFLLVILGLAAIREARRRQALSELRSWAKDTFRELSVPSKQEFPILEKAELIDKLKTIRAEGIIVIDAADFSADLKKQFETIIKVLNDIIDEVESEYRSDEVKRLITHLLARLRLSLFQASKL